MDRTTRILLIAVAALVAATAAWLLVRAAAETHDGDSAVRSGRELAEAEELPSMAPGGDPEEFLSDDSSAPSLRSPIARSSSPTGDGFSATIGVRVVAEETGDPLAGVQLLSVVWPGEGSRVDLSASSGVEGRGPITDRMGVAELQLESPEPFRLGASDTWGLREDATLWLDPLSEGERREVELPIPTRLDLPLHGIVLEADGGAPLEGARVRLYLSDGLGIDSACVLERRTDSRGAFELVAPSWRPMLVQIDAQGFGPALCQVTTGYESPELALRIRLSRAASLFGTIQDERGQGAAGWSTRLTGTFPRSQDTIPDLWGHFTFAPEHTWTCETRADGSWRIEDLPAGVTLEIAWRRAEEHREHNGWLQLIPGEERELSWRAGAGATLLGRAVRASNGSPLADIEVVLLEGRHGAWLHWEVSRNARAHTRTDARGNFRFDDVPTGRWVVAPSPSHEDPIWMVPIGRVVEIESAAILDPFELEVHEGLGIGGSVRDPDGQPAASCRVYAMLENDSQVQGQVLSWGESASSQSDGRFFTGPLIPGKYRVYASPAADGPWTDSLTVGVQAGDRGVDLRLRRPTSLRLQVVREANGLGVEAMVLAGPSLPPEGDRSWFDWRWEATTEKDGKIELTGLEPGTFDIIARTADGAVGGLQGVVLQPGEVSDEFSLRVRQGATLRIRNDGSRYLEFHMRGTVSDALGLEPGETGRVLIAPGPARVRIYAIDLDTEEEELVAEHELLLLAGEAVELVYPGP